MQRSIPAMIIRGGTSRGLYFNKADLPSEQHARDDLLIRALGGPDPLQIDGIGGGHPLSNKVAILNPSTDPDVDVDYLFLQVDPLKKTVSDVQNCGNILAGVGLYAFNVGWVSMEQSSTTVRVRMLNSGALCHLDYLTPDGEVQVDGDIAIDGVPGTAAPIVCNYIDIAGSACGSLLPTGEVRNEIDGLSLTCVDNGMPLVALSAQDLGISGLEAPDALDTNEELKGKLEAIRLQAGPMMGLGDVKDKTVPKMCLVSPPQQGGLAMTRTFIPHVCHKTIGVLGAVSAGTACMLEGSAVADIAVVPTGNPKTVDIEHAEGSLRVHLEMEEAGQIKTAGIVRTARILFSGEVYV